jgi:hypothetical protein
MVFNMVSDLVEGLVSNLVNLIQRVFINLEPTANAYYSLASPVVFAGDFVTEFYVIANDATTSNTYNGLAGTATDYFKSTSATSFTIANATSGAKVMTSPAALETGKYTRVRVRRVGPDVSVAVGYGAYGAAISGFTGDVSIDVLGQSNNANYFNGTLALPVFTNVATPADSESYTLGNLTGTTETSNGNTLTYQNIAETQDVRDLYTFDVKWIGGGLVVNGGFDTDTDWTYQTGWSISGGKALLDGSQTGVSRLFQNGPYIFSAKYLLTSNLIVNSGTVIFNITDGGGATYSAGTYAVEEEITSGTNGSDVKLVASDDANLIVDNVSAKRTIEVVQPPTPLFNSSGIMTCSGTLSCAEIIPCGA